MDLHFLWAFNWGVFWPVLIAVIIGAYIISGDLQRCLNALTEINRKLDQQHRNSTNALPPLPNEPPFADAAEGVAWSRDRQRG